MHFHDTTVTMGVSFVALAVLVGGLLVVVLIGSLIVGAMIMMEKSRDPARDPREVASPLPTEVQPAACPACGSVLPLQVETCPTCGKTLTPPGSPKDPDETDAHGDPRQRHDSGIHGA